jgi:pimeloyl-ACP methyl ester carboxylesterase
MVRITGEDNMILDDPAILKRVFFPQRSHPPALVDYASDGVIPVEKDVVLGYRLYVSHPSLPLIVYFHGNGEVAADYDMVAPYYHRLAGASLLVVDYRGYGWSTGQPAFGTLLSDTEAIFAALPEILRNVTETSAPRYLMGRSLGSAPAIHLAAAHPDAFQGLILESGFADVPSLLRQLGLSPATIERVSDEVGNRRKLSGLTLPLLVLHGEQDMLLPIAHGEGLYQASAGVPKRMERIPGAGHNNIMMIGLDRYFGAIAAFIHDTHGAG